MNSISAVTFLYNEEEMLEKSLTSLRDYVDEIIVYDLESTDKTRDLALKYTNKVFTVPYLMCGDHYKIELAAMAKSDWILWFYGDEVYPKETAESLKKLTAVDKWNSYSFMRHEYMDTVRLNFMKNNQKISYGSPECPNYQNRLHRKDGRIYYTELVHAELHGDYVNCALPPELYFDHFKTSSGQEFDNIRLYVMYKALIWKYGGTRAPEYKRYIDSYRQIVLDSEIANLKGERKIHLAEEFWWNWREYAKVPRITLAEFKDKFGIEYQEFIEKSHQFDNVKTFTLGYEVIDRAIKETIK